MERSPRPSIRLLPLLTLVVALGCGHDSPSSPDSGVSLPANAAPDFRLLDVNPNSATHDQLVSPRRYLHKVSAWYFGHST
jgi:hypothetical protein